MAKQDELYTEYARRLRREQTPEERRLWYDFLKRFPVHFYRQRVMGKYIADFYCAKAKLVLELDGDQHATERGMFKDEQRTAYLQESFDVDVYRIPNGLIRKNFDGVCEWIQDLVAERLGVDLAVLLGDPEEWKVEKPDDRYV